MSEIRKERTKDLYIDITCDLIRNDGMSAVTIRAISERAGYNSATMYSYFDNLSHLIFFAYMRFEDELLEKFKAEVNKEKASSLYGIWPRMYVIMARFYLENPNIFDCLFMSDFALKDKFDVKSKRAEKSSFNRYVMEKLQQIAVETGKNITLIKKINSICLAEITGTVLLIVKRRQSPDELHLAAMEDDLRKLIKCFMEES